MILCLLITSSSIAQDKNIFFDISSGVGRLYPNAYLRNLAGQVTFFNARVGLKTLGEKEWQRIYNYPLLGIGISHNYLTTRSLGNPTAVYSFLILPLLGRSELKLNLGMNLGVAWGKDNPYRSAAIDNILKYTSGTVITGSIYVEGWEEAV